MPSLWRVVFILALLLPGGFLLLPLLAVRRVLRRGQVTSPAQTQPALEVSQAG